MAAIISLKSADRMAVSGTIFPDVRNDFLDVINQSRVVSIDFLDVTHDSLDVSERFEAVRSQVRVVSKHFYAVSEAIEGVSGDCDVVTVGVLTSLSHRVRPAGSVRVFVSGTFWKIERVGALKPRQTRTLRFSGARRIT